MWAAARVAVEIGDISEEAVNINETTTESEYIWMKKNPSEDWLQTKSEEGNKKCNMGNVPKGHIIHSYQINIWNLNSKYHTTTDLTKPHMKIQSMKNTYHCCLCAKKSISRSHMKSHARENINPYA